MNVKHPSSVSMECVTVMRTTKPNRVCVTKATNYLASMTAYVSVRIEAHNLLLL